MLSLSAEEICLHSAQARQYNNIGFCSFHVLLFYRPQVRKHLPGHFAGSAAGRGSQNRRGDRGKHYTVLSVDDFMYFPPQVTAVSKLYTCPPSFSCTLLHKDFVVLTVLDSIGGSFMAY